MPKKSEATVPYNREDLKEMERENAISMLRNLTDEELIRFGRSIPILNIYSEELLKRFETLTGEAHDQD